MNCFILDEDITLLVCDPTISIYDNGMNEIKKFDCRDALNSPYIDFLLGFKEDGLGKEKKGFIGFASVTTIKSEEDPKQPIFNSIE